MNYQRMKLMVGIVAVSLLLSLFSGLAYAAESAPMTPEYAARKENFRKQHEQRITNRQRRGAAADLKAKRLEVYRARQAKQGKQVQPDRPAPK